MAKPLMFCGTRGDKGTGRTDRERHNHFIYDYSPSQSPEEDKATSLQLKIASFG